MAQKLNATQRNSLYKIGVISGATLGSTGNKVITGLGFKPRLVRFTVITPGNASSGLVGIGAMTETDQYASASTMAPAAAARNSSTSNCIMWVPSTSSTPSLLCSYVSMDDDGFTINVGTANSGFAVAYEAYG